MNDDGFWTGVILTTVLWMLALVICSNVQTAMFYKEAVEKGAASFVITNPSTGKTEFQWKTHEQP